MTDRSLRQRSAPGTALRLRLAVRRVQAGDRLVGLARLRQRDDELIELAGLTERNGERLRAVAAAAVALGQRRRGKTQPRDDEGDADAADDARRRERVVDAD